jgi:flagella basal body P-ring formation protein FlgA
MMRRQLISILVAVSCLGASVHSAVPDDAVRSAIVTAVRARLRAPVDVRVEDLQVRGDLTRPFVAQPVPSARTGMRVRFLLVATDSGGGRVGEAEATIYAAAPHLRAARQLHRGAAIDQDATVQESGDLGNIPIQALPDREALGGAVAAREIAKGEVLISAMLTIPSVVRSGDKVVVRAAAGSVYVQAVVVATQPGGFGDVIRCVNPDTRKAMAARIVGPGLAEVVHAY